MVSIWKKKKNQLGGVPKKLIGQIFYSIGGGGDVIPNLIGGSGIIQLGEGGGSGIIQLGGEGESGIIKLGGGG